MVWRAALAAALTISLTTVAGAQAPASSPHDVPEPVGLYQGAMHGYTPDHVTGGKVLDAADLAALIKDQHPVLLDVAEKDRKPPSMAPDTPWFPIHRTIPGAIFLQGGGSGTQEPAFSQAFAKRVAALAGDDKAKPIVAFCHPDCWGSYNAAKRLIALGYTRVFWFRDGVEGWQADHDTKAVKPDPAWLASLPADATQ